MQIYAEARIVCHVQKIDHQRGQMRKISVLLSEQEEARFCAYCSVTGHKKSTLIAHLIKEHLDRERFVATTEQPITKARRSGALPTARHFQGGAR